MEISTQRLNELLQKALESIVEERTAAGLPTVLIPERPAIKPSIREVSVAEVLEEGLGVTLPDVLVNEGWGTRRMWQVYHGRMSKPSTQPQPAYPFHCHQCGRPITAEGKDHSGKTRCDLTLLDQTTIDAEDYWTDHQPYAHEEDDDQ